MKKIMFILFAFALCLCLACTVMANEGGKKTELKAYITDKIVPVAVGVLTSVIAFVATLGTIARSLKALKGARQDFNEEAKERAIFFESGIEMLDEKAQELKALVEDVPKLRDELTSLAQECRLNSEILALGFSANSDVIKSGKGKKMAVLLEKSKSFSSSNEINPPSEFVK